jgi:hypothetical protein
MAAKKTETPRFVSMRSDSANTLEQGRRQGEAARRLKVLDRRGFLPPRHGERAERTPPQARFESGLRIRAARRATIPAVRPRPVAFVFVLSALFLLAAQPRVARAFGDQGAFDPRILVAGGLGGAARPSAPARWSWELVQRTSAPAKQRPSTVRADDPAIVEAPFLYLSADIALSPLTSGEIAGLRRFFSLGGILLVDDAAAGTDGEPSAFGRSARREIARVLPDTTPIAIGAEHVLFKTFYLLKRAEGRVAGSRSLDAIVRGGAVQVIYSSHDIGGALARSPTGAWEHPVVPGGDAQRERAIRLAVNIAMYVLCSNYKDDQVHAPFLMRRRALAPGGAEP